MTPKCIIEGCNRNAKNKGKRGFDNTCRNHRSDGSLRQRHRGLGGKKSKHKLLNRAKRYIENPNKTLAEYEKVKKGLPLLGY